jgi:hypothetical protein
MHINNVFQIYIPFYIYTLTFHACEHYFSKFIFIFICTIYRPPYMLVFIYMIMKEKHITSITIDTITFPQTT